VGKWGISGVPTAELSVVPYAQRGTDIRRRKKRATLRRGKRDAEHRKEKKVRRWGFQDARGHEVGLRGMKQSPTSGVRFAPERYREIEGCAGRKRAAKSGNQSRLQARKIKRRV